MTPTFAVFQIFGPHVGRASFSRANQAGELGFAWLVAARKTNLALGGHDVEERPHRTIH